jgi:hypothetical protein
MAHPQDTTQHIELPALTGTERQVAAADSIRAGYLLNPTPWSALEGIPATVVQESLQRFYSTLQALSEDLAAGDDIPQAAFDRANARLDLALAALRCLTSITDAGWWLDHCGTSAGRLLRVAYQEINGHGRDRELLPLLG